MSDNHSILRDVFRILCDERIGGGMSREVWSSLVLPDCVVKIEDSSGKFQNIVEWETWLRVKGTIYAKWFAPCEWISPNGTVLVMKKTVTPRENEYPEMMPVFLGDFKRTNYGLYNGQIVCHDYGTNLLFEKGLTKRMSKVEWWNV